jgi:hypothetical protein
MVTRMKLVLEAVLAEEREREELEQEMYCPKEGFHDQQKPEEKEPRLPGQETTARHSRRRKLFSRCVRPGSLICACARNHNFPSVV